MVAGTAQMDTFSNELTVMANTIVEMETGLKKETRQEDNTQIYYKKLKVSGIVVHTYFWFLRQGFSM